MGDERITPIQEWSVEDSHLPTAFVLRRGMRMFATSPARAFGIAAALNTPEGQAAFDSARDAYNAAASGSGTGDEDENVGPCARCGHDPACGFASVNGDWLCHDDDHSCYFDASVEDTSNGSGEAHDG